MTEALELLSRFQIFGGVLLAGIGWLANQFFKRRQERRREFRAASTYSGS